MESFKEFIERIKSMTSEEMFNETLEALYVNIDRNLEDIFRQRTMAVRILHDEEKIREALNSIDEYIAVRGKELMQKYDDMSDEHLAAHALTHLIDMGDFDQFMKDLKDL